MTTPEGLLPAEVSILSAAMELMRRGKPMFHGFQIAKDIESAEGQRILSHGALYRALRRMERAGLLTSWWEDTQIAEEEGRPRRRLYQVTGAGAQVLEALPQHQARGHLKLIPRLAT